MENFFCNIFLIDYPAKERQNLSATNNQNKMSFNQDSAVRRAKSDLAERLGVSETDIKKVSVKDKDFPDMSLGAPVEDEMSAQMISSGWQITLQADGKDYEYRADKYQIRLYGFKGTNYVIES